MRLAKSLVMGVVLLAGYIGVAMAYEEPQFQLIKSDGNFEIRYYAPMLIAEVDVEGDMDDASNKGFRLIADFIFGNNIDPRVQQQAKIDMTAPVTVEPSVSKIEMTAPVTVTPTKNSSVIADANRWRVQFVMPSQYTLETIPKPKNSAVHLMVVPQKYVAVYTYSGFNTISNVQRKIQNLLNWVDLQSLKVLGTPQLARYNPPWTLPFFRRNEVMVDIAIP
jgi:hypothetical protein